MKTLIIYDETGYILSTRNGGEGVRKPVGVPFLNIEIPEGKRVKIDENGIGVDISVTPHQLILEDIPPNEVEILRDKTQELELTLDSILTEVIPSLLG